MAHNQQKHLEAALEQLTPKMGWLVFDSKQAEDVVPCVRLNSAGRYEVAMITPEAMRELNMICWMMRTGMILATLPACPATLTP